MFEIGIENKGTNGIIEALRLPEFSGKYILGEWTYKLPDTTIPEKKTKGSFIKILSL